MRKATEMETNLYRWNTNEMEKSTSEVSKAKGMLSQQLFLSSLIPDNGIELYISVITISFQVLHVICLHNVRFLRLPQGEKGAE